MGQAGVDLDRLEQAQDRCHYFASYSWVMCCLPEVADIRIDHYFESENSQMVQGYSDCPIYHYDYHHHIVYRSTATVMAGILVHTIVLKAPSLVPIGCHLSLVLANSSSFSPPSSHCPSATPSRSSAPSPQLLFSFGFAAQQ